jgi:hypothetical protein
MPALVIWLPGTVKLPGTIQQANITFYFDNSESLPEHMPAAICLLFMTSKEYFSEQKNIHLNHGKHHPGAGQELCRTENKNYVE